ncbi:MAG: invasion protein CiaB [Epsilonproteobacteria bacterium]|nr:invasion protein CiaB [Campylobacterota bacterium]
MKEKFFEDLDQVYQIIKKNHDEISSYYDILGDQQDSEKLNFINDFLDTVGLSRNKESQMAAITRLVSLRDDALTQALKKADFNDEEVIQKKEEAYLWVADFHLKVHQSLIETIEQNQLLTPFYRAIFRGVHEVGLTFSGWQSSWTAHIINGINRELYRLFEGDEEKIYEMLTLHDLHDKGHDGGKGDRSYSVLVKQEDGTFNSVPYSEAFATEVTESLLALANFKNNLLTLEDDLFNQKEVHIDYLQAIIEALAERDTDKLIPKWADVDRKWMKITAPLQIGHPLEYYEDHYKKAVALEWDLRIVNPQSHAGEVKESIKSMYNTLIDEIEDEVQNSRRIYERSLKNADRVQLYLGRPALYYGAEFCGLFSAQVVPNDELITKEAGKKIFAFADNVLDSTRAKPFMQIQKEIFSEDFLRQNREVIFQKPDIWHDVYNITTIGHEYGHILWLDDDTEAVMNQSGNFKNIEEFKATTGGLVAFFLNEKEDLKYHILSDVVKRAIGLIAWKETGEVEPYYCEGLIHLSGLFETGVLKCGKTLEIDMSDKAYENIKSWYLQTYKALAKHYLTKKDASLFLHQYAQKEGKFYMPCNDQVRYFVNYYWNLHQDMGQIIDDSGEKASWMEQLA